MAVSDLYLQSQADKAITAGAGNLALRSAVDRTTTSLVKTIDGLSRSSVKTVNGLAIASVKTWEGLA